MTHDVIIDTDPGVDDALAICMALNHPDINVLGLTTVFGNVSVGQATHNALQLAELAGPVPVYQGAEVPMGRQPGPFPDFVHGQDGFGGFARASSALSAESLSAAEFMAQTLRNHEQPITLIALGPLTNLAALITQAPEVVAKVKQVIVMGGAYKTVGNVSPVAEANMMADPHAADIVFGADWPVTMVGLDVTEQTLLTEAHLNELPNDEQGLFLRNAARFYIEFYKNQLGLEGCMVHDPSTIAYLLNPSLFHTEQGRVRVITEGLAMGQTAIAPRHLQFSQQGWEDRPAQQICTGVDSLGVLGLLLAELKRR